MTLPFLILAALTVAGMAAAMTLRNLVHCVLALALGFAGLAGLYLELDAAFVGWAQILIYIGAVAILAVFVIMMTQNVNAEPKPVLLSASIGSGLLAAAVFGVLAWAMSSSGAPLTSQSAPEASVHAIGDALMHRYVLPLEILGLLLTAALIGAVVLAMQSNREAQ